MTNQMNSGTKGALLVAGTFIATIGVTFCIILLSIVVLAMEAYGCSTMNRALLVLWITIALVFIASVVVARVVAWKVMPSGAGRIAILVMYGLALLASYVVIAFGLLVLFNC